ncbi:hypothetical protein [Amycolatopsis tolypomycina]|uniref:hypothetical protein n=1 Tax=Amycolatopsis tolypomycina TaxID=208445 RepID=UPI0033B7F1D3
MLRCVLFSHRFRFSHAGSTMQWACARRCGETGSKTYGSAAEARRFARAFDREDRDDLGRRAPLLGLFPLRAFRLLNRIRRSDS